MINKIEKLTPEQESRFPEFVEKWTKIGLSTEPANRTEAERGINMAYELAGLEKPKQIIWSESPISALVIAGILENRKAIAGSVKYSVWNSVMNSVEDSVMNSVEDSVMNSVGNSVRVPVENLVSRAVEDSVRDSVRNAVRNAVGESVLYSVMESVWDSVLASVGNSVWNPVWESVRESVEYSVWASVWDSVVKSVEDSVVKSVEDSVWDSVRESVWNSVTVLVEDLVSRAVEDSVRDSVTKVDLRKNINNFCYGSHEAAWLSFYDFFKEVCGLKETKKLEGLFLVAQNCGWFLPFKNVCIVSERPNVLKLNSKGRLHSANGYAIQYPDGWGLCAWNGTIVPNDWILNKDNVKMSDVIMHENMEVRRCGIEIFGWKKLLEGLSHKIIDQDPDPMMGTLIEVDLPNAPKERFLKVLCGTGREFTLRVTKFKYDTAKECNAATYGWDKTKPINNYLPTKRT